MTRWMTASDDRHEGRETWETYSIPILLLKLDSSKD